MGWPKNALSIDRVAIVSFLAEQSDFAEEGGLSAPYIIAAAMS